MAKDVLISPALGQLEFTDGSAFSGLVQNGTDLLLRSSGTLTLGDAGTTLRFGSSVLAFTSGATVQVGAASTLTLSNANAFLVSAAPVLGFASRGSAFGEFDLVAQNTTYNQNLTTLLGGTNFGALIRGPMGGHVVVALHGNELDDTFSIVSYTTDAAPALTKAPNATIFRLTRDGQLRLPYYGSGVALFDANGALSAGPVPVASGGTGRTTAPVAGKFLTYDSGSAQFVASAFDGTSFLTLGQASAAITGAWSFTQTITGSISGNAGSATKLATARTLSFTGAATGSGTFDGSADRSITLTLASTGTPGTYTKVTTDAAGRVTVGENPTLLAGYGITDAATALRSLTGNALFAATQYYHTVAADQYYANSSTATGSLKIVLPRSWTGTQLTFALHIREASGGRGHTILYVGGTNAASAWTNVFAHQLGNNTNIVSVRFGHDGTNCCILIGTAATVWAAGMSVTIAEVWAAGSSVTGLGSGYSISVGAVESGITFSGGTIVPASIGNAQTLNGQPASYYLDFANITTNRPTTVQGYGITNAVRTDAVSTITAGLKIGALVGDTVALAVAAGTAFAPIISPIGTTNAGLYFESNTNPAFAVGGFPHIEFAANYLTRVGDPLATGASRSLWIATNRKTAGPLGAVLSVGGRYNTDAATFNALGTGTNENGATALNLSAVLSAPRFQIVSVHPTGSAGAQSNVTPAPVFEVWAPTTAATPPVNWIKLSAAVTNAGPVFEFTGSDTNVGGTFQAKGTGVLTFASPAVFSSALSISGALSATAGAAFSAAVPTVAANGSNTVHTLSLTNQSVKIANGVTDSGTRRGSNIDVSINDAQFLGTLASQRGIMVNHGHVSGAGAGTISSSVGVYITGFAGGSSAVTAAWGLYQESAIAGTKNFFGSPLAIGSTAGWGSEFLNVGGAARITGAVSLGAALTVTGNLTVGAGSRLIFPGVYEEAWGGDAVSYRNVAEFDSTTGSATGTIKITLPVSWTGSLIVARIGLYHADTASATEIVVSATNPASAWAAARVFATANFPGNTVRLAHDGTACCILIGTTSTIWAYPKIIVRELTVARASQAALGTGWTISQITSESGITVSATPVPNADFQTNIGSASEATAPSTLVRRDASGNVYANLFYSDQNSDTSGFGHVVVQVARGPGQNSALRTATPATFRSTMGLVPGSNIQVYSPQLEAFADLATNGFVARTTTNQVAARTLSPASTKITITNGDGIAGNPTFDVLESALTLGNLGGTLGVAKGGTGAATFTAGYLRASGTAAFTTVSQIPEADIIDGGILPRLAAAETITGLWTFSRGIAGTTTTVPYAAFQPTDYATGKPAFLIQKAANAGATRWDLALYDGTNNAGTLNIDAATFTHAGSTVRTAANFVAGTDYLAPAAIGVSVQGYNANLAALAGLTGAADRVAYFTGAGALALTTFSSTGRNLVSGADAGAMRTTLGLVIGTNVQAYSAALGSVASVVGAGTAGVLQVTAANTVALRPTGVAAGTDLLTRGDGDGRYVQIGGGQQSGDITVTSAAPYIKFVENDQTAPAGIWRVAVENAILRFNRNTAAAGDFSTQTLPLYINTSDVAVFLNTPRVGSTGTIYHADNFAAGTDYLAPDAVGTTVQAYSAQLGALAAFASTGVLVRTGANAFAARSLAVGSTKISLSNADGTAGNPTLDIVEANLGLNNIGGTLAVNKGGTGATSLTGFLKGNGTSAVTAVSQLAETDIADGALLARVGSAETVTGLWTYSRSAAAPASATDYVIFKPTDYGTGKPSLEITKLTTAGSWEISLFDGTNNNGTLNLLVQNLTHNGSVVRTAANFVAGTDYLAPAAIGTTVQAYHANLAALAGLTGAADRVPYFTAAGTMALATFTTAGRTLAGAADAGAQRTALSLVVGTNVQAYSAALTAVAATVAAASAGLLETTGANATTVRAIGTTAASSILTRGDGDGRYVQIGGGQQSGDITVTSAAPTLTFNENDQTAPAGVWRLQLQANVFALHRNTAAADDFSTRTVPLQFSATDVATFSQTPLVGANAVLHTGNFAAGTDYLAPAAVGTTVQAYSAQLGALAALGTNGILVRTGANAFALRSLAVGSTKISLSNADGTAGNPTLDIVEANLGLNNIGGTLGVAKGGTGATSLTGFLKGNGTGAFTAVSQLAETDIVDGTIFPRLAAAETISGLWTTSRGTAVTSAVYAAFQPTDYGAGKPALLIQKPTTAANWEIAISDGQGGNGSLNFATTGLTHNGNALYSSANFVAGTAYLAPAAIGTTVQAYSALLASVVGLGTNGLIERTSATAAAVRGIGVTNSTDLPTRADADARYGQLGAGNTWTGTNVWSDAIPRFTVSNATLTFQLETTAVANTFYRRASLIKPASAGNENRLYVRFYKDSDSTSRDALIIDAGAQTMTAFGSAVLTAANFVAGTDYVASITGTTNQITATNTAGAVTLSLPQNIHTGAAPTFAGASFTGVVGTNVASGRQFSVGNPTGNAADLSADNNANIYLGRNAYSNRGASDAITMPAATSQGWGLLRITANGIAFAGATGTFAAGATVTPTWNNVLHAGNFVAGTNYLAPAAVGTSVQAYSLGLTNLSTQLASATTGLVENTAANTVALRAIGVGATTSILTRGDGDGRYGTLSASANTWTISNLFTGQSTFTVASGRQFVIGNAATTGTNGGIDFSTSSNGSIFYLGYNAYVNRANDTFVTPRTQSTFGYSLLRFGIAGMLSIGTVMGNTTAGATVTEPVWNAVLHEGNFIDGTNYFSPTTGDARYGQLGALNIWSDNNIWTGPMIWRTDSVLPGSFPHPTVRQEVTGVQTTNATAATRTITSLSAAGGFEIDVVAARLGSNPEQTRYWKITGMVVYDGSTGQFNVYNPAIHIVGQGAAVGWTVAIAASAGLGISITVTGAASTTVNWTISSRIVLAANN